LKYDLPYAVHFVSVVAGGRTLSLAAMSCECLHCHTAGVGGKIVLDGIVWEGVDWILLAQGGDQWLAVVNMAMNLLVDRSWRVSQLAE